MICGTLALTASYPRRLVRSSRIPPLQSLLDLAERQVLGERTKAILTRHPLAVAVALAPATIAAARAQPQLLLAVARQDQLQFRSWFDLAELRRFKHFREPKYLSLLEPTPEGRHYSGVGGTGVAVILGGGWAGSSSLSFCSNRRSSASGSV